MTQTVFWITSLGHIFPSLSHFITGVSWWPINSNIALECSDHFSFTGFTSWIAQKKKVKTWPLHCTPCYVTTYSIVPRYFWGEKKMWLPCTSLIFPRASWNCFCPWFSCAIPHLNSVSTVAYIIAFTRQKQRGHWRHFSNCCCSKT